MPQNNQKRAPDKQKRAPARNGFLATGFGLALLAAMLIALVVALGIFTYYWISFGRMIDEHLAGHATQTTARIYSAPEHIFEGENLTPAALVSDLQRAGYSGSKAQGAPGWYAVLGNVIEVQPQRDSYFAGKNGVDVQFGESVITGIRSRDGGTSLDSADIEPQLVSNLFDSAREKRRTVRFQDIPPVMVDALLSAEDKRFFEHPGFDVIRIAGAAWADLRHDARAQGASTLTMQLARSFFFSTERTWRRKVAETMVSLELEQRFSKQQIFELYANEIYLGNRGSFAIHGFAEGSLAYFNKDLHDVSLGEAAFLAGIIRAPNRYSSADRRPERIAEARDRVLNQMAENHYITLQQLRDAKRAPLHISPGALDNGDTPYFVDMVKDHLLENFSEAQLLSQSFRVYTTLDPALQCAASEAVAVGMANVDQQLERKYARWKKEGQPAQAQVAVVVLDPHTGEIRAVVGGRDYGQSQLNRALARRQPGSVFKPFVYAAAFLNGVQGIDPIVTPATTIADEPTTFTFDGKDYTPDNYKQEFRGTVSVRDALTLSLNVATIKIAEMIGFNRVVQVARQMGLNHDIEATPAVALGAYDMTPVEVAAGYTAFANGGVRAEPMFVDRVVAAGGDTIEQFQVQTRHVLDPRVTYLVTNILQDVINRGTGATVRARGFMGPAAGKTGTSHDGWFAGYTSNLLAIVWVGFDDGRELDLAGASSAAPIWAEFMKRATSLPAYQDLHDFKIPDGVTQVDIDPETELLASPDCPMSRKEVFIAGTEPTESCDKHSPRLLTTAGDGGTAPDSLVSANGGDAAAPRSAKINAPPKRKGLFGKVFGIFRNKSDQPNSQ